MIFKDFNLILPDRIEKGSIRTDQGLVRRISPHDIPSGEEVRDGRSSLFLSPGFIDIHTKGAVGADIMSGTFKALDAISRALCRHGITAFLPTTVTASPDAVRRAVEGIKNSSFLVQGAQILGIHLEGPFLNPLAAGTQQAEFFALPSMKAFQALVGPDEDFIRIVTLAPELDGSEALIRYLKRHGIRPALGHTLASFEEAMEAFDQGTDHAVHLFNAMPPLHHRQPGAAGAVLDAGFTAELIADGIHVAYPVLRLAVRAKGADHLILVSDSTSASGMTGEAFPLGSQTIQDTGKKARLSSGPLAGSVLMLDEAIRNVQKHTSLSLPEVVRMVTLNPAMLCGAASTKGRIRDGYDADLVIFDDAIEIKEVYIKGRRVL